MTEWGDIRDHGACRVSRDSICYAWALSQPGWLAVKLASERNGRCLERWEWCPIELKAMWFSAGFFLHLKQ